MRLKSCCIMLHVDIIHFACRGRSMPPYSYMYLKPQQVEQYSRLNANSDSLLPSNAIKNFFIVWTFTNHERRKMDTQKQCTLLSSRIQLIRVSCCITQFVCLIYHWVNWDDDSFFLFIMLFQIWGSSPGWSVGTKQYYSLAGKNNLNLIR